MAMGKKITATEAVRKFSDLLNNIRYRGSHYTILKGGKPIAAVGPVGEFKVERTLGELPELLEALPLLGEEAKSFEADLEEILKSQPAMPTEKPWA